MTDLARKRAPGMPTAINAPAPDVHDQQTLVSSVEIDPVKASPAEIGYWIRFVLEGSR